MIRYYVAQVPNEKNWEFKDAEAICASYSKEGMQKVLDEKNKENKNESIKFIMISQKTK